MCSTLFSGVPLHCVTLAECGNLHCEYGEDCKDAGCSTGCAVDCPAFVLSSQVASPLNNLSGSNTTQLMSCPNGITSWGQLAACGGHGVCARGGGTSQCFCFIGYRGANCSSCADNFRLLQSDGGGAVNCAMLPGVTVSCSDGVRNGNEEGVDCGGPNCELSCSDSPRLQIMYIMVAGGCGVGGLAIAGVVGRVFFKQYRRKNAIRPVRTSTVVPIAGRRLSVQQSYKAPSSSSRHNEPRSSSASGPDVIAAASASTAAPKRAVALGKLVVPQTVLVDWAKHESTPHKRSLVW